MYPQIIWFVIVSFVLDSWAMNVWENQREGWYIKITLAMIKFHEKGLEIWLEKLKKYWFERFYDEE